jgi:hypothetical protein
MTKYLRDPRTGLFLSSCRKWTKDVQKAQPVQDFLHATAMATKLGLERAELYYSFKDRTPTRWDFTISIRGSRAGQR